MRLRREMEDGIDLVFAEHPFYIGWRRDVAIFKCEVDFVIEYPRVVESRTVVKLVERDDVVVARVGEDEMADKPTSAT
jgi:hypothetical protein